MLGPDVSDVDFVAYTCDQDAYAYSGQKCSAQSALFAHTNWVKAGILDKIKALAERRSTKDNTIVPVLTVTNERYITKHAYMRTMQSQHSIFVFACVTHNLYTSLCGCPPYRFLQHVNALKQVPGAKVLFGGALLDPKTHSIPACYGSFQPTAVQVILNIFSISCASETAS